MKDDEGRVLVDDYYDGIELDDALRQKLALVPDDENTIADLLQIAQPELVGNNYQEALQSHSGEEIQYRALWVYGPSEIIVPLTKSLSKLSWSVATQIKS